MSLSSEKNNRPPWLRGYERARGLTPAERGAVYGLAVSLPQSRSAAAASTLVQMKFDTEITAPLMDQCPDIGREGFDEIKALFYTLFEDELENSASSAPAPSAAGNTSMMEGGKRKQRGGATLNLIQLGHCNKFILKDLELSEDDLNAYIEAVKIIMDKTNVLYGAAVRVLKSSIQNSFEMGATYEEALYMAIEETRPPTGVYDPGESYTPHTPLYGQELVQAAAPAAAAAAPGASLSSLKIPSSVVAGTQQIQTLPPSVKKGVWENIKDILSSLCSGTGSKIKNTTVTQLYSVRQKIDETPLKDLAKGFLGIAGGAGAGYAIFTGSLPPGMKILSKVIAILIENTPSFQGMLMNTASASIAALGLGAQAGYLGAKLAFFYACVRGFMYVGSRMKGMAMAIVETDETKLIQTLRQEDASKGILAAILEREPTISELTSFKNALEKTKSMTDRSASLAAKAGTSLKEASKTAVSTVRSFLPSLRPAPSPGPRPGPGPLTGSMKKPNTSLLRAAPPLSTSMRKERKTRKNGRNLRKSRHTRSARKNKKTKSARKNRNSTI